MSTERICACGCDLPTRRSTRTNHRLGYVKGEFQRYLPGHYDGELHRANRLGKVSSPETRAKISAARLGRPQPQRPHGPWTPATRASMANRKPRGPVSEAERKLASERNRGELGTNWRGGSRIASGYRKVRAFGHPNADRYGYVFEHRLVMERVIGRYLLPTEVVHHGLGGKLDNSAANLTYCPSQKEHMRRHHSDTPLSVRLAIRTLRRLRPELLAKEAR